MEGPLYVKIESKKVWKRYHFVLRASGIYYYPKEKTKSPRDLLCHSLFAGNDVYRGIGWKKKHKAPTEYTFALKSQKETGASAKGNLRGIKMLCADDMGSLEKWVMAIRVAKYGKQLLDNHRALLDDLSREELDKFSSNRSSSIGSIISSVPSQCSNESNNIVNNNNNNNTLNSTNGRLSRASSSSSSGCLSDENNAFESDFTTGTIKRKPSMKPNIPLTSMTRQLKERNMDDSSNPTSPERGGTLTRRHSRRRSEDSCSSNNSTLKRRPNNCSRTSVDSSSTQASSTLSSPSTPTTHGPIIIANGEDHIDASPLSPLEVMPSCMTDSMFSLPPPPETDMLTASTFSLDSLPAPPSPSELNALNDFPAPPPALQPPPPPPPNDSQPIYVVQPKLCFNNNIISMQNNAGIDECDRASDAPIHSNGIISQPIYVSSMKSSIKAPPYKNPPAYNGVPLSPVVSSLNIPPKTVTFADSPVLLRRKVCFEDEVINGQQQQQLPASPRRMSKDTPAPVPPPRSEGTRLSTSASPKRLIDSTSNPPQDFLHDLQRVMRKKWQISQKCKLEPATTPHEVLGFRDFDKNAAAAKGIEYHDTSHFYRESSNVSNWVQEHYGAVTVDSLYANLGTAANDRCTAPLPMIKKRPPPPPPKRNTTTVLTHRT